MSKLDLEEIVKYDVPEGAHVLTVYLQTHSAESEEVFRHQVKEIERRFEAESELAELNVCVQRVWEFLGKFEARAPMLVLVCTATGSMWARQIHVLLPNAVRWDDTPYWKPLVEVLDEFEPYGVLLADASNARLFAVATGRIHEDYCAERNKEEDMDTYLKRVIHVTEEHMRSEFPLRLVLAGDRSVCADILRQAPKHVSKAVIALVKIPVSATIQKVMEQTGKLEQLAERRFEMKQVDELIRLAGSHRNVVLGLKPTTEALNERWLWRLVYADEFASAGAHCLVCDGLFPPAVEICPKCAVAVRPIDDLLATMIARTINTDGSVEQVRGEAAARLNRAGGIGAFLRF